MPLSLRAAGVSPSGRYGKSADVMHCRGAEASRLRQGGPPMADEEQLRILKQG